ncbi:MAG: NADPH:quinone oxidoreductase family protein [Pseudomonadota bacterium]
MRAIQITEWTSPERLQVSEIAPPACGGEEVLIRVHAAAVSHSLSLLIAGKYQRKPAFPFVPGNTVAGTVISTGARAGRFRVGDRVLASLEYGSLAEQAVAHEDNTWPIPPGLPFPEATAFNSSYNSVAAALTWPGLLEAGPGKTLLVTGAAGGVGTAAVQIGRLLGARVIAAASSEAGRWHALHNGAHEAVDAGPAVLRDAVRQLTAGEGVQAVLEPVGGAVFDAALRCLAPGGRILPIGFAGGVVPQIPANLLLVKNITVCGLYMGYYKIDARARHAARMRELFALLGSWWEQGLIKPQVGACFSLDEVPAAFARVLDRAHRGHVVVTPNA